MNDDNLKEYWAINIRYLLILISIWFTVSYGFGILLAPVLNDIQIGALSWVFGLPSKDLLRIRNPYFRVCLSNE